MADVYNFIVPNGVITTDAEQIGLEVQQEYKDAFGEDLVVTPNTPQGVLITAETLARISVADNNASLANQINPNEAGGTFLDAILALTGSQRTPASSSTVIGQLTGVAGTFIPEGSQARESVNGELFQTTAAVTIGTGGTASVQFAAVNTGPIACDAGDLTQIVSDILGWETVTNAAAATLGQETQSDVAARLFRRNTLASQGSSLAGAIIAALYETEGVKSLTFRENVANAPDTIDDVLMAAHSMYACVDGGTDQAVAQAIMSKKSGGCNFSNGGSSNPVDEIVIVPFSEQSIHVLFDRPDIIQILVRATVKVNTSIQNPENAVKQAILDYAAGLLDGEAGLIVGQSVSSFELAGAVNREYPGIYVQNMEISLASPVSYGNAEIPIKIYEKATITESSITVIIV